MNYVIRPIRADEWPSVRSLRLLALQDPVADLAFMETYEESLAKPDSFWQERAAGGSEESSTARQFVVEGPDGEWVGTLTVLMEEPGSKDLAGHPVDRRQGHIVGVYMRPEHRGCGLTEVLFDEAAQWAWAAGAERMRLTVHEDNGRAQRFYRRAGFVPSGVTLPFARNAAQHELEFLLERD
ncbi:GNAT family N-acetyltransferase [Streptomyces sp. NPDC001348]